LLKPDASGTPRPALLMIGGSSDTVVEDLYAYIGPAGLGRSYSAHVVDLPWPGTCRSRAGDAAARQGADARWRAGRPESDSKRLAAYRHQRRRVAATSSVYEVILHLL
jgi:hypothetical protein